MKSKIETNIDGAFTKLKLSLLNKYNRKSPTPKKEANPEESLETSRDKFREFLSAKMAEIKP